MAAWRDDGLPACRVGVNLFPAQYTGGLLEDEVRAVLGQYQLNPALLELEVTETVTLRQDDPALASVKGLRAAGVRIALDDFGTGYASLSTLQRFPLTTLKIDRRFVRDIGSNAHDAAIIRAMFAMGNDLGFETKEQEALLQAMGCRCGQGFLYGRAMPADEIAERLRRQEPRRKARGSFKRLRLTRRKT